MNRSSWVRLLACFLIASVVGAGAFTRAPAARADGDPASDVLVARDLFLPYEPPAAPSLRDELTERLAAMRRVGHVLKVAIVPVRADMGAITGLFERPKVYARFLDLEISLRAEQPLLVVMPNGYGVEGLGPRATNLVKNLSAPGVRTVDALAGAAIDAIDAIAGTESSRARMTSHSAPGRPDSPFTAGRAALAALLAALAVATVGSLGALTFRWRDRTLAVHAREYLWSDSTRALQTVLACVWLLDALIRLVAVARGSPQLPTIVATTSGEPHCLGASLTWASGLVQSHARTWSAGIIALELGVAAAIFARACTAVGLWASALLAFVAWWFAEACGGVLVTGGSPLAGQPGGAMVYVVAAWVAWPGSSQNDTTTGKRYSVACGLLWLITSLLWFSVAGGQSDALGATLRRAPAGMSWLSSLQLSLASAVRDETQPVAVILGLLSVAVAFAAATGRGRRVLLPLGICLAATCYVIGQGMGGVLQGQATGVTTGAMLALITAMPRLAAKRSAGRVHDASAFDITR